MSTCRLISARVTSAVLGSLLTAGAVGAAIRASRTLVGVVAVFAVGLATAANALPAEGSTDEDAVVFLTADRTIECEMLDTKTTVGNVDCVLAKALTGPWTTTSHDLYVHAHRHWLVSYSRRALVGATRRGLGPRPTRRLSVGQTLRIGYFRCSSALAGLTCMSSHSGHGFFLSSARQRIF